MSDTQNLVSGFSKDQLMAMLAAAREAEKLVQQASAQRMTEIGLPFLTTIVTDTEVVTSEASAYVGHTIRGLSFEVNGREYTASVTVTDTQRTEERKPVVADAKDFAKENRLSADDTKALIQGVLEQHETERAAKLAAV